MGNSLMARCVQVMVFPKKTFLEAAEDYNERHTIFLSLVFGFLFAFHLNSANRDLFFYITTALASGVGFVYFSGFFLSWLIKITGPFVQPEQMRMVMSYALTPYILSLALVLLSKPMHLPRGVAAVSFGLTVFSWCLAVLGIKTVAKVRMVQALFVVILPVAALLLVIAILFKIVWTLER